MNRDITMNKNSVSIQNLSFTYPESKGPTLQIDSLEIPKGQCVFIYGPSGSGKSTFLEVLCGILEPQEGSIRLNGTDFTALNRSDKDKYRSKHISFVFQNFNLIPYLNVEENIELPILMQGGKFSPSGFKASDSPSKDFQSDLKQRLNELLNILGIKELQKKSVQKLSVGQQQRVAVARAFLSQPEILLADEPTSALDFTHRENFIKLLFELSRKLKTTVLFVSHDRSLEPYFDRSLNFLELNSSLKKTKVPSTEDSSEKSTLI